jgi:Protein of unknown function (DUF2798)
VRKLPAKAVAVVFPAVMALIMTMIVSGVTTWRVRGFDPGFAAAWLPAWGLSYAVAFPLMTVLQPLARRITGALVETK